MGRKRQIMEEKAYKKCYKTSFYRFVARQIFLFYGKAGFI